MTSNKTIVLTGLDLLFNHRDFAGAEALFSPDYIQHSRFVPAGRDGLFGLVRSLPNIRYQAGLSAAEGDYVMVQGRFSGMGGPVLITVDTFRLKDGIMVEHWDVIQEEAARSESAGGYPMFGDRFPETSGTLDA